MLVPLLTVSPGILSFPVQIGKPLTGHTGDAYSLAFCPDGKTLASNNNAARLATLPITTQRPRQQSTPPAGAGVGQRGC